MTTCVNCGNKVESHQRFCPTCGAQNEYSFTSPGSTVSEKPKESSAALVCGILSLFFAGFILGVIALVLASKENAAHKTAARVLGIIGIVGWVIFIFIYSG